jgi:large subunit ribosomal protein L31e
MAEKEIERLYVVPLRGVKYSVSSRAAQRAVKEVRRFVAKHMKVETEKIWIDGSVNNALWARGKYKIPSRIRIRAVRFDDGVVEISLPEVEFKSFREELKEIKEKKKPILKPKEEEVEEERPEEVEPEREEERPEEVEPEREEETREEEKEGEEEGEEKKEKKEKGEEEEEKKKQDAEK